MKRRSFLTGASIATGVTLTTPAYAQKRHRWKLVSTWTPNLPILQDAAELFAHRVEEASDRRLRIKVFGAGELIPALGVFDAVSSGSIEMGVSSPYYWAGKVTASPLFATRPFGLPAQQHRAWILADGLKLWRDLYANFNLIPFPFGDTGPQMAGWFNKEIHSSDDLKGLKMRIPGIAAKVMAEAGSNVVLMPGGEIYTALERNTIDATEWVSPFLDERMGLYRAAKYYYSPGWHEPCSTLELMINKSKWEKLPKDLQVIVSSVAKEIDAWTLARFEQENGPALKRLVETHNVELRSLPAPVLKKLLQISSDVIATISASDPTAKKVEESYSKFRKSARAWSDIGEYAMAQALRL
jgi:TRAP-type mannitol/chloroaromatic compound transport system substrate-binding protein